MGMLYHPCTHHTLVEKLRGIVKGCIRKHIITPSTLLSETRPLVLVGWGCRLSMGEVDEQEVVDFIKKHGLKGPEGTYPKEGQYTQVCIVLYYTRVCFVLFIPWYVLYYIFLSIF